jgi:F-type H+-transporting ATPase subunit c
MKRTGFVCRVMCAAIVAIALVSVVGGMVAYAQTEASDAVKVATLGRPVWHYLGAALGLGLVVIGAASGIGRFASAAAEGIARQPAAAAQITSAVSLPLFLLEGVAIIAEVVVLLIVLLK